MGKSPSQAGASPNLKTKQHLVISSACKISQYLLLLASAKVALRKGWRTSALGRRAGREQYYQDARGIAPGRTCKWVCKVKTCMASSILLSPVTHEVA